jgi:hypothetical protein
MRSPKDTSLVFRSWQVVDQSIPVPFPIANGDLDNPDWIPGMNSQDGGFAAIQLFRRFRMGPLTLPSSPRAHAWWADLSPTPSGF